MDAPPQKQCLPASHGTYDCSVTPIGPTDSIISENKCLDSGTIQHHRPITTRFIDNNCSPYGFFDVNWRIGNLTNSPGLRLTCELTRRRFVASRVCVLDDECAHIAWKQECLIDLREKCFEVANKMGLRNTYGISFPPRENLTEETIEHAGCRQTNSTLSFKVRKDRFETLSRFEPKLLLTADRFILTHILENNMGGDYTIMAIVAVIFLGLPAMLIVGSIQAAEYTRQTNLPIGNCQFNGTVWDVHNSDVAASLATNCPVLLNGKVIQTRAVYPAPPFALNLKTTKTITQKLASWTNTIVSCYVDEAAGRAYPETIQLEMFVPLLLISCIGITFILGCFVWSCVSK